MHDGETMHCKPCYNTSQSLRVLSEALLVFNTLRPRQSGFHFVDDIFKCSFMDEIFCILIQISQNFVPQCLIANKAVLVKGMAWYRTGDKPLPGLMLIQFTDVYMRA